MGFIDLWVQSDGSCFNSKGRVVTTLFRGTAGLKGGPTCRANPEGRLTEFSCACLPRAYATKLGDHSRVHAISTLCATITLLLSHCLK